MINLFIIEKFTLQNLKNKINSLKASTQYKFEIVDGNSLDIQIFNTADCDKRIEAIIELLQAKLPILLERQIRESGQSCASFQLRLDLDYITKNKVIQYPITIENDKLISDPILCEQQFYFQELQWKVNKEQYLQIKFDVEQFGIILLLHKLRNLLNQKFQELPISFDIMIYPSTLNFAIIKNFEKQQFLYFHNQRHKEQFFEQNSKKAMMNLPENWKIFSFKSSQTIKRKDGRLIQNEENQIIVSSFQEQEQKCKSFFDEETKKIDFSLFSIYYPDEILATKEVALISNRNNYQFRKKIGYIGDQLDTFQVAKNEFNICFSQLCQGDTNLHHFLRINEDEALKCNCGNEITKENYDKLITDKHLRNLVKNIQDRIQSDSKLDSSLFRIELNINLRVDQFQNTYTAISANNNYQFEIPYCIKVYNSWRQDEKLTKESLFDMPNYKAEEDDWDEGEKHNEEECKNGNKTISPIDQQNQKHFNFN